MSKKPTSIAIALQNAGKPPTPLCQAIAEALVSPKRDAGPDLAGRIAQSEEWAQPSSHGLELYRASAAMGYRVNYKGEWTITVKDLKWMFFVCLWFGRRDKTRYDPAEGHLSPIREAMFHKRLWQAYEAFTVTGLTKEHLRLLSRLCWQMDVSTENDWLSLYVEGKRPFGNSSVVWEIIEIAELPMTWPEEGSPSEEQCEQAWLLFHQLPFAAAKAAQTLLDQQA
jgi:hypothetical protein